MGHLNATNDEAAAIGCCQPDTRCSALAAGLYATAKAPGHHHYVVSGSTTFLLLADNAALGSLPRKLLTLTVSSTKSNPCVYAGHPSDVDDQRIGACARE
jgi:hypothetical protein